MSVIDEPGSEDGYALTDMMVGLAVLGLGLGLALSVGTQALRAAREARAIDELARNLHWRAEASWSTALRQGGTAAG
ncbi:MAG TPA: hypothetical protein VEA44_10845, partial [Caulobacter sp.]|nr:hypothetical protein [Caulobacter sp.]